MVNIMFVLIEVGAAFAFGINFGLNLESGPVGLLIAHVLGMLGTAYFLWAAIEAAERDRAA